MSMSVIIPLGSGTSQVPMARQVCVVYLIVLVLLNRHKVTGTWQSSMVNSCGDNVNDLYISLSNFTGGYARCRSMKTALLCVETSSKKDPDLHDTWIAMMHAGIVDKMMKNVNTTCVAEARVLCVTFSIQEDMRLCYTSVGLVPRHTFTTQYLSSNCYPLRNALGCMRNRMLMCPDDGYIQPQIHGLGTWIDQLHDVCPGMPRLVTVSAPSNITNDMDVSLNSTASQCFGRLIATLILTILWRT